MTTTVTPERVFAATVAGSFGRPVRAALVNEVQTVKWVCAHNHRERAVAVRCAEQERGRWIRAGRTSR